MKLSLRRQKRPEPPLAEPPAPVTPQPRRVKVTGPYFGGQVPDGAVYVSRGAPYLPMSKFANPYVVEPIGPYALADSLVRYRRDLLAGRLRAGKNKPLVGPEDVRAELAGHDLACWCKIGDPCHADILIEIANTPRETA